MEALGSLEGAHLGALELSALKTFLNAHRGLPEPKSTAADQFRGARRYFFALLPRCQRALFILCCLLVYSSSIVAGWLLESLNKWPGLLSEVEYGCLESGGTQG